MKPPLISIIIPTYNRESCVGQAIDSVLGQTWQDFEVIVVDDGSTDDTRKRLKVFGDRIRVVHQENAGVSAARNAGMALASGEWLGFLDSDDLWRPEKLERQMADLALYPRAVGHAVDVAIQGLPGQDITVFKLRGLCEEFRQRPMRERALLEVLNAAFFTQATLLRAATVKQAGGFVVGMRIHEDLHFLSRIALEGPLVVSGYTGVDLRRVPSGAPSLSSLHCGRPVESNGNRCSLLESLLGDARLTRVERAEVRRHLSRARFDLAMAEAAAGRRGESIKLRWKSMMDDLRPRSVGRALLGYRHGAGTGFRRSTAEAKLVL